MWLDTIKESFMGGLDSLAEMTKSIVDSIENRAAQGIKRMKDQKARITEQGADTAAVQRGMAQTTGYMDTSPISGSPGVSMGSRRDSHPADNEKIPIK